jgi:hypothetical protein
MIIMVRKETAQCTTSLYLSIGMYLLFTPGEMTLIELMAKVT